MSDPVKESVGQLESMRNDGWFERALKAISDGEMPSALSSVPVDRFRQELERNDSNLESLGTNAPMLEAIVRATNRPPMVIENNTVVQEPLDENAFGDDIIAKIVASETWIPSVGRIVFHNYDDEWGGTGWVIQEDDKMPDHLLIATNRHVAELVARRNSRGEGIYKFTPFGGIRYGSSIDFEEQYQSSGALSADILKYTYLATDAASDVAIGRIRKPDGWNVSPIPTTEEEPTEGDPIAVIGYPARDTRVPQSISHMERYFHGLYDVKRYSPGLIKLGGQGDRLYYDATTTGGSSGSPVFSLKHQAVVGLHFEGVFGRYNSAVRIKTLLDIIAGRNPMVSLGVPEPDAGGDQGADAHTEGLADREREKEYFEGREGYDEDFLAEKVPWPTFPEGKFALAKPSDATDERPHELRYQHFGVMYCAQEKSSVVTAVNIDGEQSRKLKRTRDRWYFDMRIDRDIQIGKQDYSNVGCDRGHLVKREDPNWGDAATVKLANYDTFHYPNAAPQHSGLNRSRAQWLGLEEHIIESARTHDFRATVFTGPIINDSTVYEDGVTIPLEFWKVVVMMTIDDDDASADPTLRLHATAYLLSQGQLIHSMLSNRDRNESVEGFKFGEYRTFQISIADLEAATEYDFGELRDADPLRAAVRESPFFEANAPVYRALDDYEQIVL